MNPFSKTSSPPMASSQPLVSTTSTSGATTSPTVPEPTSQTDRSSVILAPSRLASVTASTAMANSQSSVNSSQNNYFSNSFQQNSASFLAESRLSTHNKTILRPSVLRFADSSTNNTEKSQKDNKVFAFVSLSKEDIIRPATTLLQSDSIIRCGADTTSPFNGEEAPPSGSERTTTTVSSTSNASDGNGVGSEADDSNSQSAFIFGQNLEERAVVTKHKNTESQESNETNCHKKLRICPSDESTDKTENCSQMSTTGATASAPDPLKANSDGVLDLSATGSTDNSPDKTNSRDDKRKYEVITGEEDEQNVLSMHCRLYAWETDTSTWKERGRGFLRLNDAIKDEKLCSRIVMRTSGALRVILNAHLVSGMRFDLSNEQCLRFTNVDGIYLIKGAPKDIDQLNSAIDYRLREIAKRHKSCGDDLSADGLSILSSTSRSPPKPVLPHQKASIEDLSNDS